jgi:hypothetical protein
VKFRRTIQAWCSLFRAVARGANFWGVAFSGHFGVAASPARYRLPVPCQYSAYGIVMVTLSLLGCAFRMDSEVFSRRAAPAGSRSMALMRLDQPRPQPVWSAADTPGIKRSVCSQGRRSLEEHRTIRVLDPLCRGRVGARAGPVEYWAPPGLASPSATKWTRSYYSEVGI